MEYNGDIQPQGYETRELNEDDDDDDNDDDDDDKIWNKTINENEIK